MKSIKVALLKILFCPILTLLFFLSVKGQQPRLVLPIGHTSSINTIEYSPDGKYILTSGDNTAKIWNSTSGRLLIDFIGHEAQVKTAFFSPDGKKIVTASFDSTIKIWNAENGLLLVNIKNDKYVNSAVFSPDGLNILAAYYGGYFAKIWEAKTGDLVSEFEGSFGIENTAEYSSDGKFVLTTFSPFNYKIWEAETKKLLFNYDLPFGETHVNFNSDFSKMVSVKDDTIAIIRTISNELSINKLISHSNKITSVIFSPDGNKIGTTSEDHISRIWDVVSGDLLMNLQSHASLKSIVFSPDGKKAVTVSEDASATIWNALKKDLLFNIYGHTFGIRSVKISPDGRLIAIAFEDNTVKIWSVENGKLISDLAGYSAAINYADFSPDGKRIIVASVNNLAKEWDVENGKLVSILTGHDYSINTARYSPICADDPSGGKKILTASEDNTVRIWGAGTGKQLFNLKGHKAWVVDAEFSPDGKRILTASYDSTLRIWDSKNGKQIKKIKINSDAINSAVFSPDGKKILTSSDDHTFIIRNAKTGKVISNFSGVINSAFVKSAVYSPDGKRVLVASGRRAKIWDVKTGKPLFNVAKHSSWINSANYSSDGKRVITSSMDNTVKIWDAKSGTLLHSLLGHAYHVNYANFSRDGKKIVTASADNTTKIWDAENGELLYTLLFLDSSNYLVYDKDMHYDGTEAARKMLYFTCGLEVIELEQLKDLCWEPGLVGKIMGVNKEPIKAKKLSEVSICNRTPIIEQINTNEFKIIQRDGGIGELSVYVNEKEVEKIPVKSLAFIENEAILFLDNLKYKLFFESGKTNSIHLQARTADFSMSAKGARVQIIDTKEPTTAPNLYAIVAGISDYKGADLHLNFSAKDAEDFSSALRESARKLLNIDGKEHVFVSTLVSGSTSSPSKTNISKAFTDIQSKAKPNDIVVIYLSGHGETFGAEATNFYYLTEEATSFDLTGVEKLNAISTNEFADWLRVIPARKQVMILDACASGKLAEDMLIAMRAGIPSDQIRALDRLNSRTGTFILCGAAANQSAYETSRYGQGLLTYSLLYGMKSRTALKDYVFLDIDKLFQYSADNVKVLAAGIGGIQDPVISKPSGGASFDIGEVDDSVASKIILALPKPIFTNSRFTNSETDDDNVGIEKEIDDQLIDIASKGKQSNLVFTERSQLAESYKLVGNYKVTGSTVKITVRIKIGKNEIQHFELNGETNDMKNLAAQIIEKVMTIF